MASQRPQLFSCFSTNGTIFKNGFIVGKNYTDVEQNSQTVQTVISENRLFLIPAQACEAAIIMRAVLRGRSPILT